MLDRRSKSPSNRRISPFIFRFFKIRHYHSRIIIMNSPIGISRFYSRTDRLFITITSGLIIRACHRRAFSLKQIYERLITNDDVIALARAAETGSTRRSQCTQLFSLGWRARIRVSRSREEIDSPIEETMLQQHPGCNNFTTQLQARYRSSRNGAASSSSRRLDSRNIFLQSDVT